jgi:hypothetical protein
MRLDQATVANVSRAVREINGFEWEGDFKPMARRALKELSRCVSNLLSRSVSNLK